MSSKKIRRLSSPSAQSQSQPQPQVQQPITQSPNLALELADELAEIFSHVRTPHELLPYRLVCQKWNCAIVHLLNTKWKNYFPLRLRYGPQVPFSLTQSDAEELSKKILESPPTITLIGTTTPLSFDTIFIDHDFYLAGINPEWQQFLSIYGEKIRHLKFRIRSGEEPEDNSHHVTDCAQVVSRENLRATFSAMPNLEYLDFSIRFTHYKTEKTPETPDGELQLIFPKASELPHLVNLTKITIQEPHGVKYDQGFLKEILGMAPNLTSLYIKYSRNLSKFSSVLRSLPHLDNSLTTLGLSILDRRTPSIHFDIQESGFSRFHLTKLELNCIKGNLRSLEEFLRSQCSTLVTLILGDRVTPKLEPASYHGSCRGTHHVFGGTCTFSISLSNPLALPPRMNSLKTLELNLSKFEIKSITNYPNQLPALEELTLSNCEDTSCFWSYRQLNHILPGVIGHSHSVKKFSLFGQMPGGSDRMNIMASARFTFPLAECHFGS